MSASACVGTERDQRGFRSVDGQVGLACARTRFLLRPCALQRDKHGKEEVQDEEKQHADPRLARALDQTSRAQAHGSRARAQP